VDSFPIYIVDDDESVRRSLVRLLGSMGFQAETFPSARDFLDRASPGITGCLIVDVFLPGMNGLELQENLNKMGYKLPIIFISAHHSQPNYKRAMEAGAIGFLHKPFNDEELVKLIDQSRKKTNLEGNNSPGQFIGTV